MLVCLICALNAASHGLAIGFNAQGAIKYSAPNATTYFTEALDENQISWFMSLLQVPNCTLCILSGFITNLIGRKKAMIIAQILYLSGWICTYFAPSFSVLLVARCLIGGGIGIQFASTNMYLSEISLIRFRGSLSIMTTVNMNLFVAVSLACAATLSFDNLMIVSALPSCAFLVLAIFIPESPIWYAQKGLFEDARKSLEWLRGGEYDFKEELEEMERILASKQSWKESLAELRQRQFCFPIIMMITFMMIQVSAFSFNSVQLLHDFSGFQPFSGIIMLSVYILDIFKRAEITYNHYILSICTTSATTSGYVISTYLTKKLPRKVQFIIAGVSMATNLCMGGIILKCIETNEDEGLAYIYNIALPVCVILSGLSYGLGIGAVPFALLGEVLPQRVKAVASAFILTSRQFSIFLNLKFYLPFSSYFGLYWTFWTYSSTIIASCVLAFIVMPDTRGKTLTELSTLFEKAPKENKTTRF